MSDLAVDIVVTEPDLPWIGGRFARELVARLPAYGVDARLNSSPLASDWRPDLTYHQIVYGEPQLRPAVGLFTHGEFRPRRFAGDYDGHITLNPAMLGFLREAGAPAPVMIPQPVDERFRLGRRLVFGVAGRTYPDGRKGEFLVAAMVAAGYQVIGWGHGWPCEIVSNRLEDLRAFYQSLDYYVDTSSDEGGCTPALEAMALGVPVISHTVGVDRPVLAYDRHDWPSLARVLRSLTQPPTYDDWARDHAAYFRAVLQRMPA